MATRKIVRIDEEKCDGCGLCVPSCAEGAIQIIDGKAKLQAENLCDGLGACLGDCPQDAITIEERNADEFDEHAVQKHLAKLMDEKPAGGPVPFPTAGPAGAHAGGPAPGHAPMAGGAPGGAAFSGCPGSQVQQFGPAAGGAPTASNSGDASDSVAGPQASRLQQWPIQLHLVPPTAPFFQGADLLLAADCTAFAVGGFHDSFLKGRALAVACPKLDQAQERYLEKLVAMIDHAQINTLTVAVMEVPCCGGLVQLATEAASRAERKVPVKRVTIGLQGQTLDESWL